jgi:prepilin-type N-terminal cleavage/methylation domain-containing protein
MTIDVPVSGSRISGKGGFTMIEVLVSFVVLATLTLAVQRGLAASISSTSRAEDRLGADLVARTLITAPLRTGPSALQAQRGSMNGYEWKIRFEALDLPIAARIVIDGKPPAWRPVRMTVTVSAASGSQLKIETIRLVGG